MSSREWQEMVTVGRVARPHGRHGDVIVDPLTDFPESRFQIGAVLYAERDGQVAGMTVRVVRFHRGRPIIGLEGIETISEAEALGRTELRVPASELRRLPEGQFYHHDLIGCQVVTRAGRPVGTVRGIEEGPGPHRLVVRDDRDDADDDILVPLVEEICVHVDPSSRRIVIDPPEGLLELND
jgi:16S rRNA processing protein RimM